MAAFTATGDPLQQYTAIEKAYCEDRWSDVLEQGNRLLETLPARERGLRQRLQLLLAHAHLYGFGDRKSAGALYQAVHESEAEEALRQIAAQGLEQCAPPAPSPGEALGLTLAADSPIVDPSAQPEPLEALPLREEGPSLHEAALALLATDSLQAGPATQPVMPWLDPPPAAGGGGTGRERGAEPLMAEVVDEPELLEVHQADASLAEEFELRESTEPQRDGLPAEGDQDLRRGLLRVEIL